MIPRATSPRLFGWPTGISLGAHGAAIAVASTMVALAPASVPPAPVPIEVVRVEPPPAEKPRPQPQRVEKTRPEKITRPRLVTRPAELAQPIPQPAALLDDSPRREPAPTATADSADAGRRFLAGAASSSSWSMPGGTGGVSRTGRLFSTGDLPISTGGTGSGSGGQGPGPAVASTGGANATGLTSFARPLGGYQTRPRYPDSARREGIEGETLLRFTVLASGHVASVSVARSAGHPDLDRAAIEAVKTWLFEPARRGKEAVSVWVTLPVRFQLDSRAGD